jgi:hypothetical protein
MNFKEKLLPKQSMDEERLHNPSALPRFSFESDDRLASAERLFRQWQGEETQYDPSSHHVEMDLQKEQDIIVGAVSWVLQRADKRCKSPGTDPTILGIL